MDFSGFDGVLAAEKPPIAAGLLYSVFLSTVPFAALESRCRPLSCPNPHPGPFTPGHSTGNIFVQIGSGHAEETRSES